MVDHLISSFSLLMTPARGTKLFLSWEEASRRRQLEEDIWDETSEEASERKNMGGYI